MYIDATLIGSGNNLELRGDELWDVTMGSDKEKIVGRVHYPQHVNFVREGLIMAEFLYSNKGSISPVELICLICKLIDWYY